VSQYTCTFAKEPYISTTQPYILAKEPYISTTQPCVLAKEPYISTTQPYIPTKEPYISTTQLYVLAKEPYVSTTQPYIPTKEPYISTTQPYIRANTCKNTGDKFSSVPRNKYSVQEMCVTCAHELIQITHDVLPGQWHELEEDDRWESEEAQQRDKCC